MEGLSKKEIEIVSWLEFYKKYFFTAEDIDKFLKNKTQRYNTIKNLIKKKRIIKINRTKYYLVPIKAKSGSWTEDSFIIADEICNGKDYFIGGWSAANFWHLTEQVPMRTDIYTTRRQGKKTILNTKFMFHRTTKKDIERKAVTKNIANNQFNIMKKEYSKKWLKLRNW